MSYIIYFFESDGIYYHKNLSLHTWDNFNFFCKIWNEKVLNSLKHASSLNF